MGRPVGIDLGQATALIAILEGGEPTVIANAEGSRTTPSVVKFARNGEAVVGEGAEQHSVTNMDRTIRSVRRHMGTDWSVDIDGRKFTSQQISAFILQKLKRDAEAYLGEKITDAVVTVPPLFSDAQRQATKEAAEIAGLTVLQIINEPMAAALAYRLNRKDGAHILVFDLDRQSLYVSLLIASEGVVKVRAAKEGNHFGGDDWHQRIVDWLVKDFKNGYGIDLSKDKMALQRLREAAEKAKIELSQSMESQINLPYISHSADGPLHLEANLTRAEFQRMTSDLLDRCKGLLQNVIKDARIKTMDIDHVVLVGNPTRMSAVVDMVKSLTDGKEPYNEIRPDEVVAVGACLQAGLLKGDARLLDEAPPADKPHIGTTESAVGIQTRDKVFISYSHADKNYLKQLQTHLRPYIDNKLIAVWDDTQIRPGERWRESIEHALASAKVAVLLVSPEFLASRFVLENELPPLLEAAQSEGVAILWIPIRTSSVEQTAIAAYQAAYPPESPLARFPRRDPRDSAWVKICKAIQDEYRR